MRAIVTNLLDEGDAEVSIADALLFTFHRNNLCEHFKERFFQVRVLARFYLRGPRYDFTQSPDHQVVSARRRLSYYFNFATHSPANCDGRCGLGRERIHRGIRSRLLAIPTSRWGFELRSGLRRALYEGPHLARSLLFVCARVAARGSHGHARAMMT